MASPSQNLTPRLYHGDDSPLPPSTALATWALAAATFFALGMSLGGGLAVNSAAQIVALAGIPLLVMRLHGRTPASLGLVRPQLLTLAGAALAGACTWYVSLRLALPILEAMQRQEQAERIARTVLGGGTAVPLVLLASALVPGICEELLNRGMLLTALAARSGRVLAVIFTALLFAVMHIEPARMAATLVMGLAAGWLAAVSRSVWPAMMVHVVNNTAAILVDTGHAAPVVRMLQAHPDAGLGLALGGTVGGLALATWASTARSRQP